MPSFKKWVGKCSRRVQSSIGAFSGRAKALSAKAFAQIVAFTKGHRNPCVKVEQLESPFDWEDVDDGANGHWHKRPSQPPKGAICAMPRPFPPDFPLDDSCDDSCEDSSAERCFLGQWMSPWDASNEALAECEYSLDVGYFQIETEANPKPQFAPLLPKGAAQSKWAQKHDSCDCGQCQCQNDYLDFECDQVIAALPCLNNCFVD